MHGLKQQAGSVSGLASTHAYHAHLDGIRALAVVSVFLFHLDHSLLPGGFVGVDVFFVLSGYLITGVILTDVRRREFSAWSFYQRRIARIFPAFAAVIIATYAASILLYSSQDIASVGANGAAAALSVINMKLIFQGNYFEISQDAQPLLHYWSLAVEEQFYLVYPLALLWAAKRRTLQLLIAAIALSFIGAVVVTSVTKDVAFYTLPTRAWELLAGGALAVWHAKQVSAPRPGLAELGLVGLTFSFLLIGSEWFPGPMAAIPVLSTLAILEGAREEGTPVRRLLSWRPAVAVGLLSYSLYLWHWPVFSFVDYRLFESAGELRFALKIGISIALAILSFYIIERPARRWLNRPEKRRITFTLFFVGVIIIAVAGYSLRERNYLDADRADLVAGGIEAVSGHKRNVLLIGDSKGSMFGTQMANLAHKEGFNLRIASMAARNILPGEDRTAWREVSRLVEQQRPDVLIFAYAWGAKVREHPQRLAAAMQHLERHSGKIILVQETPVLPTEASRESIRNGSKPPFIEPYAKRRQREAGAAVVNGYAGKASTTVLNPASLFIGVHGIKVIGESGQFLYQDARHLSDTGAALSLPLFAEVLKLDY